MEQCASYKKEVCKKSVDGSHDANTYSVKVS